MAGDDVSTGLTALQPLTDWLLSAEARSLSAEDLITGLAERLRSHIPLWRISVGMQPMHPEVGFITVFWTPVAGTQAEPFEHVQSMDNLQRTPIRQMLTTRAESLRVELADPTEYPLLNRFRDEGATDYLMLRLPGGRGQMCSFVTTRPGGFSPADLDLLEGLRLPLSVRLEISLARHITESLLRAYLGHNAAERVLAGQFRRAQGERVRGILFTCDLRAFTSRVDNRPLEEVLEDLDAYFECVSEPWIEHGGEVLKFIGDAVLGIMPIHLPDDPTARDTVARAALAAATEAFARLAQVNGSLEPERAMEMGYALHEGEVVYGNIGSRTRIDFTIIGPAVNEVSRLESLTKTLAPLVLSRAFVDLLLDQDHVRPLGVHSLRGVGRSIELFTT